MDEKNINSEESKVQYQTPEDNAPENLPGVEVTNVDETTQLISPQAPTPTPPTSEPKIEAEIKTETPSDKKAPNFYELYEDKNALDAKLQEDLQKEINSEVEEAFKPEVDLESDKEGIVTPQKDLEEDVYKIEEKPEPSVSEIKPQEIKPLPDEDKQQSKVEETKLKSLRTYKGDLEKVMGTKSGSLVGIASAESKRRYSGKKAASTPYGKAKKSKKGFGKKVGIIILITILVVLGIGSMFYFYGKSNPGIVESGFKIQSIIFADDNSEFNITDLSRRQILNELASAKVSTQLSIGRINNVVITKSFLNEIGEEKKTLAGTKDFLNAIDAQVPTSFLRSLQTSFMVGVHVFDGNQPFIILNTSFYENAFVGMLEWERSIKEDLSPFFAEKEIAVNTLAQVATTTEIKVLTFNDLVLKNKDTRVLKNKNGDIVLIYSFIDKNTIVITTNEHTFSEVLTRYSSRSVR
jgi:mRNA-degrading endonuclease RelE of RelBE toxin-antitoxin system